MNNSINDPQTIALISSLEQAYQLKSIPRSGWIQSGIPESGVESIASHSFGMSMLILYLRSELLSRSIDVERAINMALIHDMAEAIVGDITPMDQVTASEKYTAEAEAFGDIIGNVREGSYFLELWNEFESGHTLEAKLVKRMDKLDMLIQAYLYEKKYSIRLDSFWVGMQDFFKDSESAPIYNYIQSNRFEIKGIVV